ncbi:ribonuclease Z [Candidatus Micrarchaeota archaeon]|nr:ribonuclease Z [Candidatus Micrarchaeota archaeon]
MFQITFIGTSGGVPSVDRGQPAIALKYENQLLLWDCGEGTQRQMMKYRVGYGSIDAIFITHPHLDHYLGLFGLLETLKLSSASPRPLSLYVPSELAENFERYSFIKTSKLRSGVLYKTKDFAVSAFRVKHVKNSFGFIFAENDKVRFYEEKAHSLGLKGPMFKEIQKKGSIKTPSGLVRLEDITYPQPGRKIVYTGDCSPDQNLIDAASGADLLIHEATFDSSLKEEAKERFHSTLDDAIEVAKRAKVKRLILTHISPRYSDQVALETTAKSLFSMATVASDGLNISL